MCILIVMFAVHAWCSRFGNVGVAWPVTRQGSRYDEARMLRVSRRHDRCVRVRLTRSVLRRQSPEGVSETVIRRAQPFALARSLLEHSQWPRTHHHSSSDPPRTRLLHSTLRCPRRNVPAVTPHITPFSFPRVYIPRSLFVLPITFAFAHPTSPRLCPQATMTSSLSSPLPGPIGLPGVRSHDAQSI